MTGIDKEFAIVAALEGRFLAIQTDAVLSLELPPKDPKRPDPNAIYSATKKLIADADTQNQGDFSIKVEQFDAAYSQCVAQHNLKDLRNAVKASLKDMSSLKAAAEFVKKDIKELILPALNKDLAALHKALGVVNKAFKGALDLGLGDDDDAKRQKDFEAALKKTDEAIKKIEEEQKKKEEEAKKKDKPAGAAG